MLQYLVIAGALVNVWGALAYARDTIRGETKPNRVTWLMWSLAPLIGSAAAFSEGVTWAVLPVFAAGFGPFLVLLSSFVNRNAYWKLEKFDYLCGLCSVLALVLWAITQNAMIAIIFAIISDAFAVIPTLIKSWKHPETESGIAYSTGAFNALTSFAAIKVWTFSSYGFPLYLVIANILLLIAVYRKKFF